MKQSELERDNCVSSKPNFLIVGAAKAGTTSLAQYLNNHPDIYIPDNKELRFFVKEVVERVSKSDPLLPRILEQSELDRESYFNEFDVDEKLAGEASVHYLYHHQVAIQNIKKYLGDSVKIIIMLRDPVKRALSNYSYLYDLHFNPPEVEIEREAEYKGMGYNSFWYYKELGLYYEQVKAYCQSFSSVKVLIFEEFCKDPQKVLDDVFSFLNVDPIEQEYEIHNKSYRSSKFKRMLVGLGVKRIVGFILRRESIDKLKSKFFGVLYDKKAKYSEEIIHELYRFYDSDIEKLEELIGIDLSDWKQSRHGLVNR